ncbi:DUF5132 domain-containing protein [Azoarcus sp. DN11]|uniref:DUF5132 domain-containing protein n=1 Tax=Azoarcus sp. DN11 TaxID=356837 RepID=UPI000EF2D6CB|nr:DUF5132 domain-containing protein [Azoarcus sp. DN11]AYH42208.1 hypothetical protein CDA09_02200 [Azoarcus sp. DN11]
MGKKKHKKAQHDDYAGYAPGGWGSGYGMPPASGQGGPAGHGFDEGLLKAMPGLLKSRQYDQFLLGAAIGAAAAYVLGDEELRGKLLKTGMKLYAGLLGGVEEFKEQMADLKAEVEAEQHGGA